MSKIAVISDIHSNLHALDLVMKDMEKRNVDRIICLGDIVTKYYYPSEVVDEIKKSADIVVKGNCDDLLVNNTNYRWARGKLGLDRIEYLDSLPVKEQIMINKGIVNLYHSNPNDLDSMFNPLFDNENTRKTIKTEEYDKMFEGDNPQTTIVGHTHQSFMALANDGKLNIVKGPQVITKVDKAILNVGGVAEHSSKLELMKNGEYEPLFDPYITYLIIDDKDLKSGFKAEIIKVPYLEELKKVFFDSTKEQINGNYPYSPLFTERMARAIKYHSNDDEIKSIVDETMKENGEAEEKRKRERGL